MDTSEVLTPSTAKISRTDTEVQGPAYSIDTADGTMPTSARMEQEPSPIMEGSPDADRKMPTSEGTRQDAPSSSGGESQVIVATGGNASMKAQIRDEDDPKTPGTTVIEAKGKQSKQPQVKKPTPAQRVIARAEYLCLLEEARSTISVSSPVFPRQYNLQEAYVYVTGS